LWNLRDRDEERALESQGDRNPFREIPGDRVDEVFDRVAATLAGNRLLGHVHASPTEPASRD
jgi:hypothetical protein